MACERRLKLSHDFLSLTCLSQFFDISTAHRTQLTRCLRLCVDKNRIREIKFDLVLKKLALVRFLLS
jgi:hypothetical protein